MSIIDPAFAAGAIPAQPVYYEMPSISSSIALTGPERYAAYAVRHASYCATELMACDLQPDAAHDEWDDDPATSLHIVRYGNEVVGSARVIEGTSRFGLQALKFVELGDGVASATTVEISRVALNPGFHPSGDIRREAMLALFGSIIQHRWESGHHTFVQTMRKGMMFTLLKLGIPIALREVITIDDTSQEGVPLSGEPLYLGFVDIEEIAVMTYVQAPDVYRAFFGTSEPLILPELNRVDELARRIRRGLAGKPA